MIYKEAFTLENMRKAIIGMMSGIFILSVLTANAKADIIRPGYEPIEVNNYIKNINDFPDYVFVGVSFLGERMMGMCFPLQIIGSDGKILGGGYKFCNADVYAIEKDRFDEALISEGGGSIGKYNESQLEEYEGRLKNYFSLNGVKKVIGSVNFYTAVPVTSTQKSIANYYTIDLSKVKTEPDEIDKERDYSIYIYLGAALIALVLIIVSIVKKMRR